MKITAQQLRNIIDGELSQLDELFTPAGSIGFGDVHRRQPRGYFRDNPPLSHASSDYSRLRRAMREDDAPLNVTADQLKKLIETEFEKLMLSEVPIWGEPKVTRGDTGEFEVEAEWESDPARGEPEGETGTSRGAVEFHKTAAGERTARPKPGEGPEWAGSQRRWTGQFSAQVGKEVAAQIAELDPEWASSPAPGRRGGTKGSRIGAALKRAWQENPSSLAVVELIGVLAGESLGFDMNADISAWQEELTAQGEEADVEVEEVAG